MKGSVAYSQNLSTIHCMRVCNSFRNTCVLISIRCENFVRIVATRIMYSHISVSWLDCYTVGCIGCSALITCFDESVRVLCLPFFLYFQLIPLFYRSLHTYSAFSELITIKADVRTYTIGFSFEVNWNLSFGLSTEYTMSYAKSLRVCIHTF